MTALPDWPNATVAILGTGPSLRRRRIDACRAAGCKLFVINRAIERTGPEIDAWVWWWGTNVSPELTAVEAELPASVERFYIYPPPRPVPARMLPDPAGWPEAALQVVLATYDHEPRKAAFKELMEWGLPCPRCGDPETRCRWVRTGAAAIEAGMMTGCRRILLLGFDGHAPGTLPHFFDLVPEASLDYEQSLVCYRHIAREAKGRGVEVYNCNPSSHIDAFSRVALAEVLP
jgi:hypothetical protein